MPAALSGPGGLHCRRQCPGERPYTSAPLSFGLCPLPCPAQEVCVAGESTPGLFLDFPPSPRAGGAGCARSLVRPIFLCCSLYHAPGLFPCLFILPLTGPASHPAYAPAATSSARYRAGRAKQHNHARNVKLLPPRGSPRRAVLAASSGQSFCAAHSTMPRGSSPAFSSYP